MTPVAAGLREAAKTLGVMAGLCSGHPRLPPPLARELRLQPDRSGLVIRNLYNKHPISKT
jgi:hypothetical protein